ncbi:MAG: transcription antitermination factor NusB [Cyclobacteriaceae bacterium]|nr:transcription antitermination factor NusB [Cyclobacteriaceae bacterium]UYN87077.1 MAG: transcription antitermination factor NusB [Cyclobacteriaceae bacterium]
MLNRRSLRIKVMQSLFAFHQGKEANYLLCKDEVERAFEPDLNSMEVQDKKELTRQRKEAIKLLDKVFEKNAPLANDDEKIVSVVKAALAHYEKAVRKDATAFKKSLSQDVEKIYRQYISVLMLAVSTADAAKADKKINHGNFINNQWIEAFQKSNELKKESLRLNVSWEKNFERVRLWLRDVVKQDHEYMAYLDKKNPSQEDQKKLINHFFRRIVLGKTIINDFFEEEILHWAEDRDIVKGMVEKTVKSYDPKSGEALQLHQLSLNWEDDLHFIEQLFTGSIELKAEHHKLIADNTRNWEVERLPLTDRVILEMAITELISFPSIPVKVTINEYIELAKNYSTPKSRQFVNGILDVISKELKTQGGIKKSGRGLMDNK